jgi:hypothetical protein
MFLGRAKPLERISRLPLSRRRTIPRLPTTRIQEEYSPCVLPLREHDRQEAHGRLGLVWSADGGDRCSLDYGRLGL